MCPTAFGAKYGRVGNGCDSVAGVVHPARNLVYHSLHARPPRREVGVRIRRYAEIKIPHSQREHPDYPRRKADFPKSRRAAFGHFETVRQQRRARLGDEQRGGNRQTRARKLPQIFENSRRKKRRNQRAQIRKKRRVKTRSPPRCLAPTEIHSTALRAKFARANPPSCRTRFSPPRPRRTCCGNSRAFSTG